jgi:hypothetical protein
MLTRTWSHVQFFSISVGELDSAFQVQISSAQPAIVPNIVSPGPPTGLSSYIHVDLETR